MVLAWAGGLREHRTSFPVSLIGAELAPEVARLDLDGMDKDGMAPSNLSNSAFSAMIGAVGSDCTE